MPEKKMERCSSVLKCLFKRFVTSRYQLMAQAVEQGMDGELQPSSLVVRRLLKVHLNSELFQALIIKRSMN